MNGSEIWAILLLITGELQNVIILVLKILNMPNKPKKNQPLTPDQEKIEFLKKELEDAKLLAEGYRRMIEIAESELKIPIRKKPNTR